MSISRRDFDRVAEGFRYVANDPAADAGTVAKMIGEFVNAASALNPAFDAKLFRESVYAPYNGTVPGIFEGSLSL
jgi:hypothetical protein